MWGSRKESKIFPGTGDSIQRFSSAIQPNNSEYIEQPDSRLYAVAAVMKTASKGDCFSNRKRVHQDPWFYIELKRLSANEI